MTPMLFNVFLIRVCIEDLFKFIGHSDEEGDESRGWTGEGDGHFLLSFTAVPVNLFA